jgi:hypothetical protein
MREKRNAKVIAHSEITGYDTIKFADYPQYN